MEWYRIDREWKIWQEPMVSHIYIRLLANLVGDQIELLSYIEIIMAQLETVCFSAYNL